MAVNQNPVVVSRVKPPLIRRRAQVPLPQNVTIIVQPSRAQVVNLRDLKKHTTPPPASTPPPTSPKPPSISAVSRQQLIKQRRGKRQPQVKYISPDTSPESVIKIAQLRWKGRGKVLVMIGNGPSITEVPLEQLLHQPKIDTLTINKPDQRLWPTTYWAFFDLSQFRRHEDLWNGYSGTIFNSTAIKRQKPTSMQFKNIGGRGWSHDLLKGLHIGRSSVFASMQIAAWMDYDQVYIFGCDMHPLGLNGKLHFYGQNPDVDPRDP
jgi:hypothetical protein